MVRAAASASNVMPHQQAVGAPQESSCVVPSWPKTWLPSTALSHSRRWHRACRFLSQRTRTTHHRPRNRLGAPDNLPIPSSPLRSDPQQLHLPRERHAARVRVLGPDTCTSAKTISPRLPEAGTGGCGSSTQLAQAVIAPTMGLPTMFRPHAKRERRPPDRKWTAAGRAWAAPGISTPTVGLADEIERARGGWPPRPMRTKRSPPLTSVGVRRFVVVPSPRLAGRCSGPSSTRPQSRRSHTCGRFQWRSLQRQSASHLHGLSAVLRPSVAQQSKVIPAPAVGL